MLDLRTTASVASLLALVSVSARAQGVQYAWPMTSATNAAGAGDVDADGFDDFVLGNPANGSATSWVRVRSGRTGAELLAVAGAQPGDTFGSAVVGLGDIDGDGHADFAASAPLTVNRYVRVLSGATGAVLWERTESAAAISLGASLARLRDVDGDGADELVVGSSGWFAATTGEVLVLSGRNGAVLRHLASVAGATPTFGAKVASAGDVDLDGVADVLVADSNALGGAGRVTTHSGANGAILSTIVGPAGNGGTFAAALASVRDVTGDGVADVLVGSPQEVIAVGFSWGRVRLYSGADGALLRTIEGGGNLTSFGISVDRFPDLDGDGKGDLLIAAGAYKIGCCTFATAEVRVYSSGSGVVLMSGQGQSTRGVTTIPDANRDGVDDYLVPSTSVGSTLSTAVALTNATPPAVDVACVAKTTSQGCVPVISSQGAPSPTIGDDFTITATGVTPSSLGLYFWSLHTASTPFGGGTLCVGSTIRRFPALSTSSGPAHASCPGAAAGSMTMTLSKSALAGLFLSVADVIHVQGYFRDSGFAAPNNVGLTGSLAVTMWL